MVQCFQIFRKILCPLDASKFWLVLFESLYWKKSFKLLFRQTGNWNSQIYLRQNYRANFLWCSVEQIWSKSYWWKYFAILLGHCLLSSLSRAYIFLLPRYSPLNGPIQNTPTANMLIQYLILDITKDIDWGKYLTKMGNGPLSMKVKSCKTASKKLALNQTQHKPFFAVTHQIFKQHQIFMVT